MYARRTWVLILPCVVFIVAPCNAARVCALACFSGLGLMAIYLINTYGLIRHGDSRSKTFCLVVVVRLMFLDAIITYNRSSIGTREAFMQEAASFASFSDPRVGSAGPTRKAPARGPGPSGRQPCITLKKANPQGKSADSTRRSAKNNPRVIVD